jgi:hypothetical protein
MYIGRKNHLSIKDPRKAQLFSNLISSVYLFPTVLQTFDMRIVNKPGWVEREIIIDDYFDNDNYDNDRRGQFISHAL